MKYSLLVLLFVPVMALAARKGEVVEKKIHRDFTISSDGNLLIDNRYGNIDVAIGESNHIKMDITMRVEAGSTKKAQETLDRISVSFIQGNNRVEARTAVESGSGWGSWTGGNNVEMEIHYQVLVPADIYMQLTNKYGNIYVETTNRDLRVNLGYGDIRLGDIHAKLYLDMAYSEGTITRMQDADLTLSYSDLEMEDANSVNLEMKYTDIVMGSMIRLNLESSYADLHGGDIDEFNYRGKYDDIVIDRVKTVRAETAYTGVEIGGLSQEGMFDLRYGDLHVENISAGFSKINVTTSYTGVVLDFQDNASFSLDAETNYCDIHHAGLRMQEHIEKGASRKMMASKGSGGGQVIARMNYGELTVE